jgi:RHS repeat-associated protein
MTVEVKSVSDGSVVAQKSVTQWYVKNGYISSDPESRYGVPNEVLCVNLDIGFFCQFFIDGPPLVEGSEYTSTIRFATGEVITSPAWPAVQYASVPASMSGICTCAYQARRADPVNTAMGALLETTTDVALPGAGHRFALTRHYRSDSTATGLLGPGWSTPFEARLDADGTSRRLVDADGAQVLFTRRSDGSFVTPKGVRYDLAEVGGSFVLTDRDHTRRAFDAAGRLVSLLDPSGVGLAMGYDAAGRPDRVTDAAGRVVRLAVDATTGRLTDVTLPDTRTVAYSYTGGRLTGVRGVDGATTGYGYDAAGRLGTVTDARGNSSTTTYDPTSGRVVGQVDLAGQTWTFGWDEARQVSTMTDPRGGSWTDTYSGGALVSHSDPLGHGTTRSYDADLNVVDEQDANAGSTNMTYDARANLLTRDYPDGTFESWTYDSDDNVLTHVDPRSTTTTNAYDAKDRLVSTTTPVGTARLTYTAAGQVETSITPAGRTSTFGYDGAGNLTSRTSPGGARATYGYDSSGRRIRSVDPRGNVAGADPTLFTSRTTWTDGDRPATATDALGRVTAYGYDANRNLTSVRDPAAHVSTTAYDAANRPIATTDPGGATATTTYDASGNRASTTDPRGARTTFGYDRANRLVATTSPRGNAPGAPPGSYTSTYAYDGKGNRTRATDPSGAATLTSYDSRDRPSVVTDPLGKTTTLAYDDAGNQTSATDRTGATTYSTYDAVGRLETTTDALSSITVHTYDADGNRTSTTTPLGNITKWTYDADGRRASAIEARGNVTGGTPASYTTAYAYDPAGNLTKITDPLGNATGYTYDAAGQQSAVVDAAGQRVAYGYDDVGQVSSVLDPLGHRTSFGYDAVGNLTARTDANGHTTAFGYDEVGQLTKITDALARSVTYSYDLDGYRVGAVNARGTTTASTVDPRGLVTGVQYSDATRPLAYGHDANGRTTSITDATGTRALTYDAQGRLASVAVPGAATKFAYSYDANGDLSSRTYPDGRVMTYNRDPDRRVTARLVAGASVGYGYDAAGHVIRTALPLANGHVETRTWDRAGRLSKIASAKGTANLSSYALTLDKVGRPTSVAVARAGLTAGTQTYAYDAAGRLTSGCLPSVVTSAGCPAGSTTTYSYDAVGNRLTSVTGGVTTNHTYDAADQLTRSATGTTTTSYGYDADGNQVTEGARSLRYDADGRLVGLTSGTSTYAFTNDDAGNRVSTALNGAASRVTRWDVNNPLPQIATETTGSGTLLADYEPDPDGLPQSMHTAAGSFFYHHDWLGSTSDLTSSAGVNQSRRAYDPFGRGVSAKLVTTAPSVGFGFTGQYADTSVANRYYLRARSLDVVTGRFATRDPVGLRPAQPYVSTYAYVDDAPTYLRDPSGKCSAGSWLSSKWQGLTGGGLVGGDPCDREDAATAAGASSSNAALATFSIGASAVADGAFDGATDPLSPFTTDNCDPFYRLGNAYGAAWWLTINAQAALGDTVLAPGGGTGRGAARSGVEASRLLAPSSLADEIANATGGVLKVNKGGYTIIVPNGSRGIVVRIMERGGSRTNYYRISVPGKEMYTVTGETSTDPAFTHIGLVESSLDDILRIVNRIQGGR